MALREPVLLDPDRIPTRKQWPRATIERGIALSVELCHQLHGVVLDKRGAATFYPSEEGTLCRFEWSRRWKRQPHGLRLGLLVHVDPSGRASLVDAYAADHAWFDDIDVGPPRLTRRTEKAVEEELAGVLALAESYLDSSKWRTALVLRHIRVPAGWSSEGHLATMDGAITLHPARIVENHWVAALVVRCRAPTARIGREEAGELVNTLCVLLTLGVGQAFYLMSPKWPSRTKPDIEANRLYPPHARSLPRMEVMTFGARATWLWAAWNGLKEESQARFRRALQAFQTARQLGNRSGSVASVALVAAVGTLAKGFRVGCGHDGRCPECESPTRHWRVGDRAAIVRFLQDVLEAEDVDDLEAVSSVVKRVYSEQRSAFVHEATLRHGEVDAAEHPFSRPVVGRAQSRAYRFQRDLELFGDLVRVALLRWLAREGAKRLDRHLFGLQKLPGSYNLPYEMSVSIHSNRWTRLKREGGSPGHIHTTV